MPSRRRLPARSLDESSALQGCCLFPCGFGGPRTKEGRQTVAADNISKSVAAPKAFSGTTSSEKHALEKIRIIFPEIFTIHVFGAFCLKSVVPSS